MQVIRVFSKIPKRNKHSNYLLLIQPLTPYAPLVFLELITEYWAFDLTTPLNIIADHPLNEDTMFLRPPLYLILNTDLAAEARLVNLPLASTLIPLNFICFNLLVIKYFKGSNTR
jgi:hypothetical protein